MIVKSKSEKSLLHFVFPSWCSRTELLKHDILFFIFLHVRDSLPSSAQVLFAFCMRIYMRARMCVCVRVCVRRQQIHLHVSVNLIQLASSPFFFIFSLTKAINFLNWTVFQPVKDIMCRNTHTTSQPESAPSSSSGSAAERRLGTPGSWSRRWRWSGWSEDEPDTSPTGESEQEEKELGRQSKISHAYMCLLKQTYFFRLQGFKWGFAFWNLPHSSQDTLTSRKCSLCWICLVVWSWISHITGRDRILHCVVHLIPNPTKWDLTRGFCSGGSNCITPPTTFQRTNVLSSSGATPRQDHKWTLRPNWGGNELQESQRVCNRGGQGNFWDLSCVIYSCIAKTQEDLWHWAVSVNSEVFHNGKKDVWLLPPWTKRPWSPWEWRRCRESSKQSSSSARGKEFYMTWLSPSGP